jgi:hypothetical protein
MEETTVAVGMSCTRIQIDDDEQKYMLDQAQGL